MINENFAKLLEEREFGHKQNMLHCQRQYAKSCEVFVFGEEHTCSFEDGTDLALSLKNAHHAIEAERLAANLLATSKRVLGRAHKITRMARNTLRYCKVRIVGYLDEDKDEEEYTSYQLLNHDAVEDKYIIKGPIKGTIQEIMRRVCKFNLKDAKKSWLNRIVLRQRLVHHFLCMDLRVS